MSTYVNIPASTGGGASTAGQAAAVGRAQALFGAAAFNYSFWDFVDTTEWAANPAGNNNGSAPTYCDSTHTTNAPSSATLTPAIPGGAQLMMSPAGLTYEVANARTAKWYCEFRMKTSSAMDATSEQRLVGLFNATALYAVVGTYRTQSATNYMAIVNGTIVTSSVALDTAAFRVHALMNDLTTVTYLIDGVAVATAPSSALPASPMGMMMSVTGTGQPINIVDYAFIAYAPPT